MRDILVCRKGHCYMELVRADS